jgi:GNAT superfamily N-acetyltransferase
MIRRTDRHDCTGLSLVAVSYDHPDSRDMLRRLHSEQLAMYGFADSPDDTDAGDYVPPAGLFLMAYLPSPGPSGCGGWRRIDETTAEIKRMYVVPDARGHGLGRIILQRLEQHAAASGVQRVLLETGRDNTAALGLYSSAGYTPISAYRPGRNPDVNRALRKELNT